MAYFRLRETVVDEDDQHKEFTIYSARGRSHLNRVKLVRNGWHEIEFCLSHADAKRIWEMDFNNSEGLEAVVADDSREKLAETDNEDDEPVMIPDPWEQRLWPLVPHRIREIKGDSQCVLASFRVASFPANDFARTAWESYEHAETIYANEGAVNAAPTTAFRTEYSFLADVRLDYFFNLAPSTPQATLDAASVGQHHFVRSDKLVSFYRSLTAVTGTYWRFGLDDGKMHVVLADAEQEAFKPAKYLVEEARRIEKKWVIPFLGPNRFNYRQTNTSSTFLTGPTRTVVPTTLTIPPLYQPTNQSLAQRYRPVSHYSTLLLPHLAITTLEAYSQAQLNEHAQTWERAVKAAERTINGWFRASSRNDWYRLGGYHPVVPGAEIASVTYQNGTTLVDYRDSVAPLWPRIPTVSMPVVSLIELTIQSGSGPTYVASVDAPHSGPWPPGFTASGAFDNSGQPIIIGQVTAEDTLGLFPWLMAGDKCLALFDGSRAVIIQTTVSLDVQPPPDVGPE